MAAVDAAASAFKSWKKTKVDERRDLLNRAADILLAKLQEGAKRQLTETNCATFWPHFDINAAAGLIKETAAALTSVYGNIPPSKDSDNLSLVFKEPLGPVLIIPPSVFILIIHSEMLIPSQVECAIHTWIERYQCSNRSRMHSRVEGIGNMPRDAAIVSRGF